MIAETTVHGRTGKMLSLLDAGIFSCRHAAGLCSTREAPPLLEAPDAPDRGRVTAALDSPPAPLGGVRGDDAVVPREVEPRSEERQQADGPAELPLHLRRQRPRRVALHGDDVVDSVKDGEEAALDEPGEGEVADHARQLVRRGSAAPQQVQHRQSQPPKTKPRGDHLVPSELPPEDLALLRGRLDLVDREP